MNDRLTILTGHWLERLRELPDESVLNSRLVNPTVHRPLVGFKGPKFLKKPLHLCDSIRRHRLRPPTCEVRSVWRVRRPNGLDCENDFGLPAFQYKERETAFYHGYCGSFWNMHPMPLGPVGGCGRIDCCHARKPSIKCFQRLCRSLSERQPKHVSWCASVLLNLFLALKTALAINKASKVGTLGFCHIQYCALYTH